MAKSRLSGSPVDGFRWLDGRVDRTERAIGRDGHHIERKLYAGETGLRQVSALHCHGLRREKCHTGCVSVHPERDQYRWNALVHGNNGGKDRRRHVVSAAVFAVDRRRRQPKYGKETTNFGKMPRAVQRSIHESQGGIRIGHRHDDNDVDTMLLFC